MPAAVGDLWGKREGRYGGRAESGMKKALNRGILAMCFVPRSDRVRYPVKVPGLADKDISFEQKRQVDVFPDVCGGCYLGLEEKKN